MSSVIASQRWSNLAENLTLTAAVNAEATTFTVDDDSELYAIAGQEYLVASLGDSKTGEIVHIYELLGSNQCAVTRAQEGTTAQAWPQGTVINIRVTAGSMNAIVQALGAAEDALAAQALLPAFCTAYSGVAQEIADATPTVVAFEAELYDTDTLHDTETNNSRLTASVTGTYKVSAFVEFEADADGYREAYIRKGGTTIFGLNRVASLGGSVTTTVFVSADVYLAADEYVELVVNHTAGAAIDVVADNGGPQFAMHLIRGHEILGGGT